VRGNAKLALMTRYVLTGISLAYLISASFGCRALDGAQNSNATPETPAAAIESRTITVRINRPFATVYEFLVVPQNWNQWATGLGKSLRPSDGDWIADTQAGQIKVRFTPRNKFGIVDHYVQRKSGAEVYVPMRLIVSGNGCELMFTLFREPNMSDAQFTADAGWVQRDLDGLKGLLER
jgi:hypothetical protein